MKIKIKHNIKREGCTLSGQILDCQFKDGAKRGDWVDYFSKDRKLVLTSVAAPQISYGMIFVWGKQKARDLYIISYTYPTEQAAQDMLDFINTFTDKEEPTKEKVEEKPEPARYALVRVGGDFCDFQQEWPINSCSEFGGECPVIMDLGPCPHGKTLEQISDEIKKLQGGQDDKSI